ncbi:MAG: hypothetical protein Q8R36_04855 [bacterium]|nr:hypothetical protein [bacterium]
MMSTVPKYDYEVRTVAGRTLYIVFALKNQGHKIALCSSLDRASLVVNALNKQSEGEIGKLKSEIEELKELLEEKEKEIGKLRELLEETEQLFS